MNFLFTLCVLLTFLSACTSDVVVKPEDAPPGSVLVTADRYEHFETQLSLIGRGNVPTASATIPGHLESALLLADSATMLLGVVNADARRDLVTVDARTLRERSRRTISNRLVPVDQGDVGIRTAEALTESIDRQWLYVSQAARGAVVGIARVNKQTYAAEAFSGPWQVRATLRVLPAGAGLRDGALVVVATRESVGGGPPPPPAIYLLHPLTLIPLDSITTSMLGDPGPIINLLVLDRGATLLIGTSSRIIRFDLVNHRISASVPRLGLGAIVPLADGGPFAVLDQGRFPELTGSGIIYLLSPELTTIDSIDVSTPLGGAPRSPTATVMGGGVFDESTGELYVRTGSAPFGTLYPAQPARTLVVNVRDRSVIRIIPLLGDNFGLAFRTR